MTRRRGPVITALVLLIVTACGGSGPTASTPDPTPGPGKMLPELKLALVDAYGPLWYCDPDFYPIQRQDELAMALERWPEVVADTETFAAVTAYLGLDPSGGLTDEHKLDAYRLWKMLNAIPLDPIGDGTFRYDYLAQPFGEATSGIRTAGTITADGRLFSEQAAEAGEPICPICLAAGVQIDTPGGRKAVETLGIGDPVWTLDAAGARIRGEVIAIGSTQTPAGHHVVRVILADGRTLSASPGHPLADGRLFGDLRVGDGVGGSTIRSAGLVAYDDARTYDIAVSGSTGIYLVNGIALGSTLRP